MRCSTNDRPNWINLCYETRYNDYPTQGREDKTEALGINEPETGYSAAANPTAAGPLTASNTDPFNSNYVSNTSSGMSTATEGS